MCRFAPKAQGWLCWKRSLAPEHNQSGTNPSCCFRTLLLRNRVQPGSVNNLLAGETVGVGPEGLKTLTCHQSLYLDGSNCLSQPASQRLCVVRRIAALLSLLPTLSRSPVHEISNILICLVCTLCCCIKSKILVSASAGRTAPRTESQRRLKAAPESVYTVVPQFLLPASTRS